MKILFLEWKSYGNEDIVDAVAKLNSEGVGIELELYPFDNHEENLPENFEEVFAVDIRDKAPDFVMSFNYFPVVSKACNSAGVNYVSWVYDNPAVNLYSYTLVNPCNYVFLFDSQMYEVFASQGINTVYYLPMAAAVDRYDAIALTDADLAKWGGKVSFVGQMYTDEHNFYERMEPKLTDYAKGYLEGIMRSQMEINGISLIEQAIAPSVMKEMVDALGAKPNVDGVETYDYIYSNYVVDRKITSLERTEIISMIGEKYPLKLYTREAAFAPAGVDNRGEIDYYKDMPYIFKASDINLNITLRSIQRGIPLRAMDIMGCGGFLLTNYQEDMLNFFVPGEDYVYYESRTDLIDKIGYYLEHEDERKAIAESGHAKVKAQHTYEQRLREIIEVVRV